MVAIEAEDEGAADLAAKLNALAKAFHAEFGKVFASAFGLDMPWFKTCLISALLFA